MRKDTHGNRHQLSTLVVGHCCEAWSHAVLLVAGISEVEPLLLSGLESVEDQVQHGLVQAKVCLVQATSQQWGGAFLTGEAS